MSTSVGEVTESVAICSHNTTYSKNFVFPEILHVFYGILTFFCITFDALEMRLIVTDVVLTITQISIKNQTFHFLKS